MQVNIAECFLKLLEVLFSNNIDIKVCADPLFDNFEDNYIIFLFFLGLDSGSSLNL